VTLFLYKNLLEDLIYYILSKFHNIANKHKAKTMPASYCIYIKSFAYKLYNIAKGNNT
jgi:hypothetical protein